MITLLFCYVILSTAWLLDEYLDVERYCGKSPRKSMILFVVFTGWLLFPIRCGFEAVSQYRKLTQ